MMQCFGEGWLFPPDLQRVDTPVGRPCQYCAEAIKRGDAGVILVEIRTDGQRRQPLHVACYLRMVMGSVGHIRKACGCYGGKEEDPPGLTRKQAAEAALFEFSLTAPFLEIS